MRQKLSSGLQKVGAGFTALRTKLVPKGGAGQGAAGEGSGLGLGQGPSGSAFGAGPAGGGGGARALTEAGAQQAAALERERDVLVRLGLAAFAVAAYVKAVLCPSLPRQSSGRWHHLAAGASSPT